MTSKSLSKAVPTPVDMTERVIEVSGGPVRVRIRGEGTPLLLINGLGANVAMWTPLVEQLGGFKVITFDAPGTGNSYTPLFPYTIAGIADVASEVLDALGHQRADVLGYSLGGAVAQELAQRYPERVRRLVIVSSSCGAGAVPGSLRALLAVSTPLRQFTKTGYRLAMNMVNLAPAEKESGIVERQLAKWQREARPSVRGYMLQMTAFSTFHSLPWLHRVRQPALVLAGAQDRIVPAVNSAILATYLADARLQVFDKWGHYLLHDASSGAAATIADFLSAEDHASSSAWTTARTLSQQDLKQFVREAPRSAHPASFTSALVRRLHPVEKDKA
jgi:poly(3-hydroxyoctanoate) depolymerase